MKRLIISGLSVVLLSAIAAPAVKAESRTDNPVSSSSTPTLPSFELPPFNLVYMAYQGYFEKQGIPSAQALISAYRTSSIDAEDIVESAVKANRLPSSVMADDDYLNAVDIQLRSLDWSS